MTVDPAAIAIGAQLIWNRLAEVDAAAEVPYHKLGDDAAAALNATIAEIQPADLVPAVRAAAYRLAAREAAARQQEVTA